MTPIKVGEADVVDVRVGETEVQRVMVGETEVWARATGPTPGQWAATYEAGVNATNEDDGYRNRLGGYSYTGIGIVLGDNGSAEQDLFVRLSNVTIPPGATITDARITFIYRGTTSNVNRLNTFEWRAVDEDDATAPTTESAYNSQQSNLTSVKVDDQTAGPYTAGDSWESANLAPVLQAIIDRAGWASGNDIVLHGTYVTSNFAQSWQASTSDQWSVVVDYLVP